MKACKHHVYGSCPGIEVELRRTLDASALNTDEASSVSRDVVEDVHADTSKENQGI